MEPWRNRSMSRSRSRNRRTRRSRPKSRRRRKSRRRSRRNSRRKGRDIFTARPLSYSRGRFNPVSDANLRRLPQRDERVSNAANWGKKRIETPMATPEMTTGTPRKD